MSKHTPGPWYIKRRENWSFLAIYHIEKRSKFGFKARPDVATVYTEPIREIEGSPEGERHLHIVNIQDTPNPTIAGSENKAEAEANARLIAAAPDMLKALRLARASLKVSWEATGGASDGLGLSVIDHIDKVLAKVAGKN